MAPLALLSPEQAQAREVLLALADSLRVDGHDELARRIEIGATDGIPQAMAEDILRARGLTPSLPLGDGATGWCVTCCHGPGTPHARWWHRPDEGGGRT